MTTRKWCLVRTPSEPDLRLGTYKPSKLSHYGPTWMIPRELCTLRQVLLADLHRIVLEMGTKCSGTNSNPGYFGEYLAFFRLKMHLHLGL